MTAKRKGGALAGRLEALEAARAAQVEEVKAGNWELLRRALAGLSPADRVTERDALAALNEEASKEDRAFLIRLRRACEWQPEDALDVLDPAKKEAEAWADAALDVPEGVAFLPPPADRAADFVAYFEKCGQRYDEEARRVPLSPDVHRLARWGAVLWRFDARLCEVLAGLEEEPAKKKTAKNLSVLSVQKA